MQVLGDTEPGARPGARPEASGSLRGHQTQVQLSTAMSQELRPPAGAAEAEETPWAQMEVGCLPGPA